MFFSQGKIEDRVGFFPANFVQKVQPDEKVFRCIRTFIGCKEQGQITLKENQVSIVSMFQNSRNAVGRGGAIAVGFHSEGPRLNLRHPHIEITQKSCFNTGVSESLISSHLMVIK